ncbi:unnamed protein product [Camellia sinensis]
MLKRRRSDETPVTSQTMSSWPANSRLKKKHSVEYWMIASLVYDGEDKSREAVRVSDPESDDVFFVPFFSSLSFNTHEHNMNNPDT